MLERKKEENKKREQKEKPLEGREETGRWVSRDIRERGWTWRGSEGIRLGQSRRSSCPSKP